VAVVICIVAFSKNAAVGFFVPLRIVEPMRGIEVFFSENANVHNRVINE
jgi:hypothetical protein